MYIITVYAFHRLVIAELFSNKNYKKMKIKDGKAWKWLREKAPDVIELVGDVTGIQALENAGKILGGRLNKGELRPEEFAAYNEARRIDLEEIEAILKDKDSARVRESEIVKTLGHLDPMQVITGSVGLLAFVFIVLWAFWGVDPDQEKIYFHVMGLIEGVAISIFSYYFGSSKGSKDKTKMLWK